MQCDDLIDPVKLLRVGREDRFFIILVNVFAREQLVDLVAAMLGVEAFVRKIGGEKKRFIARFPNGEPQTAVIAVEADENSAGLHMPTKIFARHDIGLRARQEVAMDVDLQMVRIGAVEAIHEKRHPRRAAFEKTDAQFRESIEYAVGQHRSSLRHDAERMTEGMHGIINTDRYPCRGDGARRRVSPAER